MSYFHFAIIDHQQYYVFFIDKMKSLSTFSLDGQTLYMMDDSTLLNDFAGHCGRVFQVKTFLNLKINLYSIEI